MGPDHSQDHDRGRRDQLGGGGAGQRRGGEQAAEGARPEGEGHGVREGCPGVSRRSHRTGAKTPTYEVGALEKYTCSFLCMDYCTGAGPLPTHKKTLSSPFFRSLMAPFSARATKSARTSAGLFVGLSPNTRAAPPETWGQAIDVPEKVADPVSSRTPAEVMALPGAQISVQLP